MAMNPKIEDWQGRRVWLVGASSGIGAALAQALASRGARLALSARSAEKLAALDCGDALRLPCDATDAAQIAEAHRRLLAAWGGIDLVVKTFDLARAEAVVEVNFSGALRLAAAVLPSLSEGSGLALVASVAGYRGLPKALCYGPGKAALIHLAECLHLELAPRGIGVWLINPGFVQTRLTAQNEFAMPALMTPDAAADAMIRGFATGHFEIHFPKRFTGLLKLVSRLPYRWYFPLIRRFTGT